MSKELLQQIPTFSAEELIALLSLNGQARNTPFQVALRAEILRLLQLAKKIEGLA